MPGLPDLPWTKTVLCLVIAVLVTGGLSLNGPNVCMVKQKYNITKLVKYRAPMSIRTYEWCFSMPPRCSKWNTEMRDLTKLETEERTAEVAVCCPGYKMRDVSCVPICPSGRTGARCSEVCPRNKWGPNCVNDCKQCDHGSCSPVSGECWCEDGWQGESCESSMPTTTVENILTTTQTTPMTIAPSTKIITASIATSTTAQPSISTTSITSRPTIFKSTTELSLKIPITENTIAKESVAPIEINMFNAISINSTEKAISLPKEDISASTERSSTTSDGSTTISNITLQNKNQYHKEIITVNPAIIQEKMTVNDNNNMYDKNAVNDATHTIQLKDLISTQTAVVIKQDTTTKEPMTDIVLLKNNSLDNNTVKPKSILLISNITTSTSETTTNIVEIKSGKQTSIEATTTSTMSENRVQSRETENLTTTEVKSMVILTTPEPPKVTMTISHPPVIQTESITSIETTTRVPTTTAKFKPKEIWIKPAQKGDSIELKSKNNHEFQRHKPTNKELSINTTPKTIIVSIIPTSVSYATFKKIALTTTAYLPTKVNTAIKISNKTEQGFTKAMPTYLTTTSSTTEVSTVTSSNTTLLPTFKYTSILPVTENTTISVPTSSVSSKSIKTNSMTTNAVTSNNLTISTNSTTSTLTTTSKTIETTKVTKPVKTYHWITAKESFKTNKTLTPKLDVVINRTTNAKVAIDINKTLTNDKLTTETPSDEETFHILTEPEHITAVMGDKESDRTSMDLKSVISIAGGVMMAVITVAVIIVMIERCKRPRYEDVRKINDIRMQVMIEDNDVPPPYVRSIFHTPLPEPPMPDKCHYQPISTLDRNLKQFMRPVVVQAISPIMLENFRGILECHYDHLPRRSHDFQPIPVRCSVAPSVDCCELTPLRGHTVSDRDIDSMKREAKLDEIDTTTAEPLYAEIPCWRPPSEHAVEILNLNGEAVTEL